MRRVGFLLLLSCAIAALLMSLAKRSHSKGTSFTLPNGRRAQIEATTFGISHTFTKDSWLLAQLRKALPRTLEWRLPSNYSSSATTVTPALLLWFDYFDPASGTDVNQNANLDSFEAIDEHGCVFSVHQYTPAALGSAHSVGNIYFYAYPRRQRTFKVNAEGASGNKGLWIVENPFVTNPVPWKTESFPVVRQAEDGTQFSLERIGGAMPGKRWFDPQFKIMRQGQEYTDRYDIRVDFSDATGNRTRSALCPYEPAWKLDVTFRKNHKAVFAENQIWRIPNVFVPGPGEALRLIHTNQVSGVGIRIIALCGPGEFSFSNSICTSSNAWKDSSGHVSFRGLSSEIEFGRNEPTLLLETENSRDSEFLIRFKHTDGSLFSTRFFSGSGRLSLRTVDTPPATGPFDLEIIPQSELRFEYIVKPPRSPKKEL
jgi:hypothetical protein